MKAPNAMPIASSQYARVQPPCLNPPSVSSVSPPGACITPSNDRNSETINLRMVILQSRAGHRAVLLTGRRMGSAQIDRREISFDWPYAAAGKSAPVRGSVRGQDAMDSARGVREQGLARDAAAERDQI